MTRSRKSPANQSEQIYSDGGTTRGETQDRPAWSRLFIRLNEAGLSSNRIIPLPEGSKKSTDQHHLPSQRYDAPDDGETEHLPFLADGRNYGVYGGDGLVIVDIDDYDEEAERSAELDALPETFTTQSPHGGEHRYYVVDGDLDALRDATDAVNPAPTWGEVQAHNKYVVGPGSQLDGDGCTEGWCDDCATADGGYYTIQHDTEIATLDINDLIDVVSADPTYDDVAVDDGATATPIDADQIGFEGDVDQRLERALEADETLRALWNGNYTAASYDDRSTAECALASRLAFWFNKDKNIVRRLMDRADTQKWAQRTDDSYRESVLRAVDAQPEVYTGEAAEASSLPEAQLSDLDVLQDESDVSLTKQEAYDRCRALIRDAIDDGRQVLIEALPTIGKSVGAVEAVAETGVQATILTQREDLYDEAQERCEDLDLSYYILPSVSRSCPTYQDKYGGTEAERIRNLHERGVSAREIHEHFRATGNPLPCQRNGDCPSKEAWDFDPEAYDVLIGHYLHANMEAATADRYVFIDEFVGDAFDTELDKSAANTFLEDIESKFDTATDVLEARRDEGFGEGYFQSLEMAIIKNHLGDQEETNPLDDSRQHRYGAEAAYVLIASDTTVNEFDRVEIDESGMIGLHDRRNDTIHIRDPPSFDDTNAVICLDGTPTKELWESALGLDLDHERVLTDAERRVYMTEIMGWEFVQTTEYVYPYSSGQNVNVDKDRALIEEIRQEHGEWPTLISTAKAIQRYRAAYPDLLEHIDHVHHGDLKGTNELRKERLGVITGSRHYGRHAFIGKEAAFVDEKIDPEGSGLDKTYNNEYGDNLLRHMREHETLQAMLRFGRDGDGARVYVHTAAIPEWVSRREVSAEIRTHGDGMQQVLGVLKATDGTWTVRDVVDDERVSVSRKQVSNLLNDLAERGVLDKRRDGRANVYHDADLDRMNEYGVVELDPD